MTYKAYFDNAATTRVCTEAAEAAMTAMTESFGNPSSSHSAGRAARKLLEDARSKTAAALGGKPEEVYFTAGGTEADNWAVLMGYELMRHRGKHVISAYTEHDAVLKPLKKLEESGVEVTYLKPDKDTGAVSLSDFREALREDTVLVSLMLVNNETGAKNPITEAARVLKDTGSKALLHTDAVQAFCKTPFSVKTLGADMVSVSGHKIHAPKGSGALWVRSGVRIKPLLLGGGQERGSRSGTEAVPAIAAFGEAAKIGASRLDETYSRLRELREYALSELRKAIPDIMLLCDGEPSILSLSLPGYRSEVLVNYLDAAGICVSQSSACKMGGRSHVLTAMGLPSRVIDGAVRVSFCRDSSLEEVKYFVEKLAEGTVKLAKSK